MVLKPRLHGDRSSLRSYPISPEIRAKAAELTKNASDDNAKLNAIYDYVSTQFRYIGIAFGIGRYQPHAAAEVLANQYGDCKDKHTLLASLLDAVGIKAYAALINSSHELDLDVPSLGQFDHVITVAPQGSGFAWLDTTPEVAPYGYLLSPLRDKRALVIPIDKPPVLVVTPADPLILPTQIFSINAKLNDDGRLEGKIEHEMSGGDAEVLLRMAFRRVPLPQWKDLVQQVSYSSGFGGDVSDVTASSPEKIAEPFRFSYTYTRKDFPDWANHRIAAALPPLSAAVPDPKPSHPIWLGSPQEFHYESHVQLPKGYSPELPVNVDLKEDFAEYHAAYSVKDSVLAVDRRMSVKLHEVPDNEYEAYKRFSKAIEKDNELYVNLSSNSSPVSSSPGSLQSAIANLPMSDNLEAMEAFNDAIEQTRTGAGTPETVEALQRAVKADPHFVRAWMMLAEFYGFTGEQSKSLDVLQHANAANPDQAITYRALINGLMGRQKYGEAIPVLQALMKIAPQDSEALFVLGRALVNLKRYDEAIATFESAVKVTPDNAAMYEQLGQLYLKVGNDGDAAEAFKREIGLDPSPAAYNDIAFDLADANKNLPLALDYAGKAVRGEEEATQRISLAELQADDLRHMIALPAYWDTLGWVYFRMGKLDQAEKYLNAAWVLAQDAEVASHLGQVYEAQKKKQSAAHMYRLSLYRYTLRQGPRPADEIDETRARLEHLSPGISHSSNASDLTDETSRMRISSVTRLAPGTVSAEFFLILVRDPSSLGYKIESSKFISGSETLKSADKAFNSTSFRVVFPDEGPTRLLRRGSGV